ncbi:MAG: type II toxin-antitoxin system death-on-curing family toxin [Solirubrobacteraceae bacterium]
MSIRYVELADYLAIAAEITGLDTNTLIQATKIDLAESALHAPAAGFGETEFYPDFIDKAAVLIVRLAKNHPLLDGNKRAAWVALRLFIEINDWTWRPTPTVDDAEQAVLAVAAGAWSEHDIEPKPRPPSRGPGRFVLLQNGRGARIRTESGGFCGAQSPVFTGLG